MRNPPWSVQVIRPITLAFLAQQQRTAFLG
jgi:hypothetical protein